jgi:hypothetical protein
MMMIGYIQGGEYLNELRDFIVVSRNINSCSELHGVGDARCKGKWLNASRVRDTVISYYFE